MAGSHSRFLGGELGSGGDPKLSRQFRTEQVPRPRAREGGSKAWQKLAQLLVETFGLSIRLMLEGRRQAVGGTDELTKGPPDPDGGLRFPIGNLGETM